MRMDKQSVTPFIDDWNANKEFLSHLVKRITLIDEASETGDVLLWFNRLRILYRNTGSLLTKKPDTEPYSYLDDMFQKAKDLFNTLEQQHSNPRYQDATKKNIKDILDDLNVKLIEAIHINDIILPKRDKKEKDKIIVDFIDKYVNKSVMITLTQWKELNNASDVSK